MSMMVTSLIKLTFLRVYHSLKPHILFSSIHPAIWHSFPVITQTCINLYTAGTEYILVCRLSYIYMYTQPEPSRLGSGDVRLFTYIVNRHISKCQATIDGV